MTTDTLTLACSPLLERVTVRGDDDRLNSPAGRAQDVLDLRPPIP
jgi:hypothetical protein